MYAHIHKRSNVNYKKSIDFKSIEENLTWIIIIIIIRGRDRAHIDLFPDRIEFISEFAISYDLIFRVANTRRVNSQW